MPAEGGLLKGAYHREIPGTAGRVRGSSATALFKNDEAIGRFPGMRMTLGSCNTAPERLVLKTRSLRTMGVAKSSKRNGMPDFTRIDGV
ncbi:hypothetical protein [Rhizobium sp. 57MFTsu3.2]|uniref:hypothetical protein n=1 Tax=Rhizobium sp. 57MFTsu3.2 TaxID=1048681 RepID=UPI001469FE2E|nr:hypothetical protein [Rhizobium sp. 57MFTsu3.2]